MQRKVIFFTLTMAVTSVMADVFVFPNCIRGDVNNDTVVTLADLDTIELYIEDPAGSSLSCHDILRADINLDRQVDQQDVDELAAAFGFPDSVDLDATLFGLDLLGDSWGDINGDGIVTPFDIDLLTAYLQGVSPLLPSIGFVTGDINGDGELTRADLGIFRDCDAGKIDTPFPGSFIESLPTNLE